MSPTNAARVAALLTLLAAWFAVADLAPPAAVGASAPAERFSAERAAAQVREIAREPHPIGSPANARVRDYLLAQISALGLEPTVQTAEVVRRKLPTSRSDSKLSRSGTVNNVLARLVGRESGGAVLLMAHYDSVPTGPGAADDASGSAVLLETLRALKAGPPLRNDLLFLWTDGEEAGLLGAQGFADQSPLANEVKAVLNFEARGTRGPSLMFETQEGNGPVISLLARSVGTPQAHSWSQEVYKRLPNDTDFTVFKRKGLPGLNFAFIDGVTSYHAASDEPSRLDLGSVQHHGEQALALARALGELDLGVPLTGPNAAYFKLPGPFFVRFPLAWVLPLGLLIALFSLATLALALRRGVVRAGRLAGAGGLTLLFGVLAALLLVGLAVALVPPFHHKDGTPGYSSPTPYLLAVGGVALVLLVLLTRWLSRRLGPSNLAAGGLLLWLAGTLGLCLAAPGAAHLFLLPLLLGTLAFWLLCLRPTGASTGGAGLGVVLALLGIATAFVWLPALVLLGTAVGPVAAALWGLVLTGLVCGPLAPLVTLAVGRGE